MRYLYILTIASSLVLITACNEKSVEENCSYYIQQQLDNKNFDGALTLLNSTPCQESYPDDEYKVDQALAQLGKSGYSFPTIVNSVLEGANNRDNSLIGELNSFAFFLEEIAKYKNNDSYEYLQLSENTFEEFLGDSCWNIINADPTPTQTGICLLQGAISLTKSALAIDFLSGGDIKGWIDKSNNTISLTTCALQYVDNGATACSQTISVSVLQTDVLFNNKVDSFESFKVTDTSTIPTRTEYFLKNTEDQFIFTNNYCETDFSSCDLTATNTNICFACPNENSETLSVNEFLLESLNEGINNIESLIVNTAKNPDDSDLLDSVTQFKHEIVNNKDIIEMSDLLDYLDK